MAKFFGNSKNTMTVMAINKLKTHGGSSIDGVHISARRTETTMATKRNKLKVATTGATIHCATKRRVTTTKHSVNVINDRLPRMSDIYKFFIMIIKNVL